MPSSLIRGKYVVCKASGKSDPLIIEDGAVFQRDGIIIDVGTFETLACRHSPDEVLGSDRHIVFPGFVNSHHHGGLLAFQMGTRDLSLEQWTVDRIRRRDIDPYLDTLYSAFEMIESGITTVQHLHSRSNGPVARIYDSANQVLKAYQDIGMRVSYSFGIRDQNRLVYESDEAFLKRLPFDLATEVAEVVLRQGIPLEDNFQLFEQLYRENRHTARTRIQLAASNLQWCSDRSLIMLRDYSDKYQVPVHMHLLETRYQKEYAKRRTGGSAIDHLHELDLLGPQLTLGHAVWATESDIELIADTDTRICHSPSSNLRLRSGIAPIARFAQHGVRIALGMDDASINDDRSLLQEMRVALRLHRTPGMEDDLLTEAAIFQMATENGALTTPFGATIGTLEVGKAADIVIMDWQHIAHPYLDASVPIVNALVHLARTNGIETVLIAGEPVLRNRRFTRLDKEAAVEELAASLRAPLKPEENRRQLVAERLFPHVKKFYADEKYAWNNEHRSTFHCMNCRY